jgi:hypothetical protein
MADLESTLDRSQLFVIGAIHELEVEEKVKVAAGLLARRSSSF